MRAHGVRRTTDERTPEDHIGLMLALMSYLARNQPDDLDEFLQIHLLTWSSHFLDQLVERRITRSMKGSPGLRRPRSKAFSKHATST